MAETGPSPGPQGFPATRWTLIRSAAEDDEEAARALCQLCQAYWYPVYAYLRRTGKQKQDAEDLAQAFFARILKRKDFTKASPEKGRLRTFLLTALKRFVIDESRKEQAVSRGGREEIVSIDEALADSQYQSEPSHDLAPDVLFQRRWVTTLLALVMEGLREEWREKGKLEIFDTLEGYIPWCAASEPQADAADKLRLPLSAVRKEVFRLRRRYQQRLRLAILDTVDGSAHIDAELADMRAIFQQTIPRT